jgi:hypothetical protein
MKKLISLSLLLPLIACAGGGVRFQKSDKYDPKIARVVTMAVFDMGTNSAAKSEEEHVKIFGSIAQTQVGSLHGSIIPGGDLTLKAAEAIGLKKDLDTAVGKMTEAIVNSNSVDPQTTVVFAKIAAKLGVEGLAFPLVSGDKSSFTSGGVSFRFVLYDVRTSSIVYVAQTEAIEINSFVYDKADDTQKNAMVSSATSKAVNDLFGAVKKGLEKK